LAEALGVGFAFPTRTLLVDQLAAPGAERVLPSRPDAAGLAEVVNAFGPEGDRARPSGPRITHGYAAKTAPAAQSSGDG